MFICNLSELALPICIGRHCLMAQDSNALLRIPLDFSCDQAHLCSSLGPTCDLLCIFGLLHVSLSTQLLQEPAVGWGASALLDVCWPGLLTRERFQKREEQHITSPKPWAQKHPIVLFSVFKKVFISTFLQYTMIIFLKGIWYMYTTCLNSFFSSTSLPPPPCCGAPFPFTKDLSPYFLWPTFFFFFPPYYLLLTCSLFTFWFSHI